MERSVRIKAADSRRTIKVIVANDGRNIRVVDDGRYNAKANARNFKVINGGRINSGNRCKMRLVKAVALLLFVVSVGLFISINVKGSDDLKKDSNYYINLENTFTDLIRVSLENSGYKNAGVTVTSVIDIDGSRDYRVKIHHYKIDELEDEKRAELMDMLTDITYPYDECDIDYIFI